MTVQCMNGTSQCRLHAFDCNDGAIWFGLSRREVE